MKGAGPSSLLEAPPAPGGPEALGLESVPASSSAAAVISGPVSLEGPPPTPGAGEDRSQPRAVLNTPGSSTASLPAWLVQANFAHGVVALEVMQPWQLRPEGVPVDFRVRRTKEKGGEDVWMKLPEAAQLIGCTKPNGRPRNSFYTVIKRNLGPRKRISRTELDDLVKKGEL